MIPIDLRRLQHEVRDASAAAGWFDTDRPFAVDIALLHGEVNEFVIAELTGGQDGNVPEELADILILLLYTAGRHGLALDRAMPEGEGPISLARRVPGLPVGPSGRALDALVAAAYKAHRKGDHTQIEMSLARAYRVLTQLASMHGVALDTEVRAKLEINRQRGYRNGDANE